MTKQQDSTVRWVAIIAGVALAVGGWLYASNGQTEVSQWKRINKQGIKIGENALDITAISVQMAADDRRITERNDYRRVCEPLLREGGLVLFVEPQHGWESNGEEGAQ